MVVILVCVKNESQREIENVGDYFERDTYKVQQLVFACRQRMMKSLVTIKLTILTFNSQIELLEQAKRWMK